MARYWSKRLSRTIRLKSGKRLVTLRDAGKLIGEVAEGVTHSVAIEHAAELLMRAAETGTDEDCAAATDQLEIVLH